MSDGMAAAVCLIEGRFSYGTSFGTGFLISPDRVLTCAHNLFLSGEQASSAIISFGDIGSIEVSSHEIMVLSYYYTVLQDPHYNHYDYDVGLIRLPAPLPGRQAAWRAIAVPDELHGRGIEVRTLPQAGMVDRRAGVMGQRVVYRLMRHSAPTEPGFSGGPVIEAGGGAIAIHTLAAPDPAGGLSGFCVAIDEWVRVFIERDGAL